MTLQNITLMLFLNEFLVLLVSMLVLKAVFVLLLLLVAMLASKAVLILLRLPAQARPKLQFVS